MNQILETIKSAIHSGALIPLLIMLPNLAWMLFPAKDPPPPTKEPLTLTVMENVGRIATFALPFFYELHFERPFALPVALLMILVLAGYYFCWLRYFSGGKKATWLHQPLLGIPLPMAVLPVLFFLLSAYLLRSWWMLTAAVLFGVCHIWVSKLTLRNGS